MAITLRVFFVTLSLVCNIIVIQAQHNDDVAKSISSIKRDKNYLYAEVTMKDREEASQGAKAILETIVSDWVHKQFPNENIELCIVKAKDKCQVLQTQRCDHYRTFVYVKKNDILTVSNSDEVEVFHITKEKDKLIESAPYPQEEPTNITILVPTNTIELDPEEKKMLSLKKFNEIEPYVKELLSLGKLDGYGKYATMPKSTCHLFIYNKEGEIVAVIRKDSEKVFNLGTLVEDHITNYKNCGAIWLRLKQNKK